MNLTAGIKVLTSRSRRFSSDSFEIWKSLTETHFDYLRLRAAQSDAFVSLSLVKTTLHIFCPLA